MAPDELDDVPTFETPEGAEKTSTVAEDRPDPEGREPGAEVPTPMQPDTVEVPEGARSSEADAAAASTDGVYGDADPTLEPGGSSSSSEEAGEDRPLDELTNEELLERGRAGGFHVTTSMTKAELVSAIENEERA